MTVLVVAMDSATDVPGSPLPAAAPQVVSQATVVSLPPRPTRRELKTLDDILAQYRPADTGPSLEEIQASNAVPALGIPQRSQLIDVEMRIIVYGDDSFFSLIVTRLMRRDEHWIEVAYVPTDPASVVAANFAIPTTSAAAWTLAATGEVHPIPLIRDDSANAVVGYATIHRADFREITGEIIVDDTVLLRHEATKRLPRHGNYGVRLVPMNTAPGIAAARAITTFDPQGTPGVLRRLFGLTASPTPAGKQPPVEYDPATLATGRALQAGGLELVVTIDGIARPRPVKRVTFYRHLRDLQLVRPADPSDDRTAK
ncbi:hypothetical protein ACFPVT_02030 [Corynebacterium choanae]|uniref:Uncharacterized protein n=1 Tax=Corynebacterium choanae TaxID=1862358 RepID=A0A3G6J9E8_9CORY|nr:hypothetical protein [Corynebacterium choanae]AZA12654.1 hypothetical protein CCHOA_01130 [Corynebacterium choanae]